MITLTESAVKQIKRFREDENMADGGLHVAVVGGGCSGLSYKLEFQKEPAPNDKVFEQDGVKVFVDPKSLTYIDGTELDFVREGLNEGFKFQNPNVKDECGCGKSFRV